MELSDAEVIQRVLDGDKQAFSLLVRKYEQKVFRLCLSMAGPDLAEDAAQEAFLKAYQALERFEGRSSFSTWLYRVTANHCLNLRAERKRRRTESLDALAEQGITPTRADPAPSSIAALESRQTVELLLGQLDAEERLVLSLREIEGLTYQEIAETLEISLEAVKSRIFRARQSLMAAARRMKI